MISKKKCASCKSPKIFLLLNLGSTALANSFIEKKEEFIREKKYPLKLYMCKSCKLVQVFHNVKPSEFFVNYDYLSGASSTWIKHCKKYTKDIIKKFNLKTKNGPILEIASNDGVLIENFYKKNFKCIGIEPSITAHKIAKKKGINSINKFFNHKILKKFNKISPQLIIANNVIAHVKNINDFVRTISKISNDKTVITIEFPFVYNLKNKNQFDTIYHEHHYYYSLHSISELLKRHKLELFDIDEISIHGGSYRVYVKKFSSNKKITNKLKKLILFERKIKLNSLEFYKNFQKVVNKIKTNTIKTIEKLKSKNKIIHAYGAAAKGNTFLNFCKITNKEIEAIYDLNSTKVGKYLPGSKIKIFQHDKIKKYKPDYIAILPWNIFFEVKKQLSYTRKWGCKLIKFLPKVDIKN